MATLCRLARAALLACLLLCIVGAPPGVAARKVRADAAANATASSEAPLELNFHCSQSWADTDGYICQSNKHWGHRRDVTLQNYQQNLKGKTTPGNGRTYFQENWHPEFRCELEQRLGRTGDGGKWVCNPSALQHKPACLVYSVGSNTEFSFEEAVLALAPHCSVHTFDMTTGTEEKTVGKVHFHPWGLGAVDDAKARVFTLPTIMSRLGHSALDILKIDIEGNEYGFLQQLFSSGQGELLRKTRQIQLEFHYGWGTSRETPDKVHHDIFEALHNLGFVIFDQEPNIQYSDGGCIEYSFLRMSKDFFKPGQQSTVTALLDRVKSTVGL